MDPLIALYRERLNLQGATFSLIEHEDAMVALVYKVTGANGSQLILKICSRPDDYLRELYFLRYFATLLPVPRIVQAVPPEAEISGAILMECLPGTLLTTEELTDELAYELGLLLAGIHLNRTAGYGDLIKPDTLSATPHIPFTAKFEEGLAECAEHLPKELIGKCRSYYNTHLYLLDSIDGPCIIHRDFRPGNVLVHAGKLQGIIDWSSARTGFAEEDFCLMEHGEWPNKKAFLAGYASIRPVPNYMAIMTLLRLNKAIGTVGFTVKRGTWENSHARIYQLNRRFLETFF